MCYFIILVFPDEHGNRIMATIPQGLYVDLNHQYTNDFKNRAPEHSSIIITDGFCSCSMYHKPQQKSRIDRLEKKYRKKGWNEQKIERALRDISLTSNIDEGLRPDLAEWVADLAKTVCPVYLFVHWDSDKIPKHLEPQLITCEDLKECPKLVQAGKLYLCSVG